MISIFKSIASDWNRYLYAYDYKKNRKNIFLRLAIFFHNPNMIFVVMYRIEHYLFTNKNIFTLMLGYFLYPFYFYFNYFILDIHIHPQVMFGKGLYLHYRGIIITQSVVVGENLTLIGPLTIGTNLGSSKGARIGNNVTVCAGARVIGEVHIGNNVIIGANAVVVKNIPSDSVVGGVPAEVLKSTKR